MFFRYVDEELLRTLANKKFLYLNLNLLNLEIIDALVKTMLKDKIEISRFNLTDLLDEIIADPKNLQTFIETVKKLKVVMVKECLIIVNHINDYSLCVEVDKAIIVLNVLLKEVKEIKNNPRVEELPILEQFNDNYLKSFIKYSVYSADKRMFYPDA